MHLTKFPSLWCNAVELYVKRIYFNYFYTDIEVEFSLGKVFTTGLDAPVTANLITLKIWLYLPIATIADISWVFIY